MNNSVNDIACALENGWILTKTVSKTDNAANSNIFVIQMPCECLRISTNLLANIISNIQRIFEFAKRNYFLVLR